MSNLSDRIEKKDAYDEQEDGIDIREILLYYLRYWKWFVASILVFLFLGGLVYLSWTRSYQVSTSVLIKEEGSKASASSAISNLEDLGLLSTTNNVDNEIAVFSSPNLIRQTIDTLGLFTTYFEKGLFRQTEVYKQCPYTVELDGISPHRLKGDAKIVISQTSKGFVYVSGVYQIKKKKYDFPSGEYKLPCAIKIPSEKGRIIIDLRPVDENNPLESLESDYIVNIANTQAEVENITSQISVESTSKTSSVLDIILRSGNAYKSVDILRKIVEIYNSNNVEESNVIAYNTSRFVNDRLLDISTELKSIENKVVSFKKEQGITDVGAETKVFLEQNADIEKKRVEAETQLKLVQLIEDYINKNENHNKLIPNLGISDEGLASIIGEYNNMLLSYDRIERSSSEDNPVRARALASLKNMRQNIQSAVLNVKKAMNINKRDLADQANLLTSRKGSIPQQEYGLTEILRQQQVIQAIYIFLMQTREQSNITLAATSDKAKVITDPIIPPTPVSPKRNLILIAFFFIGLIVPVLVIYIRDLFKVNISSREELERLATPNVIGEIARSEEGEIMVVRRNSTSPIVELFRSLRNNLQFILSEPGKKVILVTSTIPNEGKTFVAINLAASFALSDKKVLLIGMDIRNPQLAVDMNFTKGKGLTSFLTGDEKWGNLLSHIPEYPNLDILQAGVIPPNPNELLMKPILFELFKELRVEYDIVVIDSAPLGVVSDTLLIAKHADATVYVTRENVTPKAVVDFINSIYKDKRLSNPYLVINDVNTIDNKKKYGYKYKYGYGYESADVKPRKKK
ncbi:MAG: ptk [Bacteroidetes bacterium]|nr:ptk [Bacteroidota bacterium]